MAAQGLWLAVGAAQAATYTWDAGGGTDTNFANATNWDTGSGDPPDTTFLNAGLHDLVFASGGLLANPTGTTYSVRSLTFTKGFRLGRVRLGNSMIIGAGGVTLNNTVDGLVTNNIDLKLSVNTFIANNSTQDYRDLAGFIADSARSITNNGSGTGWVRLMGGNFLNGNVTLVQDSLTSGVSLESAFAGAAIAGRIEIRKGLVSWNIARTPWTGNTLIGSTTANATDWAKLQWNGANTSAGLNALNDTITNGSHIVSVGTVGTNIIASGLFTRFSGGVGYLTSCFTGGVSGANALYLENVADSGRGDDNLLFANGAINMTNKLIHIGAGTGITTIASVIGTNVTGVIQNSATSRLILSGANTFSGDMTVNAGTLQLDNLNALQNSTLDTGPSGAQSVNLAASGTYNIGGLKGSDDLAIGANTIQVGTNNQSTTYGGVLSGTGGGLTKIGTGTLLLTGNNTYTGPTAINNGKLVINGFQTGPGAVTIANGTTLGGTGAVAAVVGGAGAIDPGNSPGIFAINQLDPGAGLDFNFEFTAQNPDYTTPNNDILRITNATPFTASFGLSNEVNLYVSNLQPGTNTLRGGFYTDRSLDFLSTVTNATYNVYVANPSGAVVYNGSNYEAAVVSYFAVRTVDETGTQFGSVNGWVTEFELVVVPEPGPWLLTVMGCGLLAWRTRRWRTKRCDLNAG